MVGHLLIGLILAGVNLADKEPEPFRSLGEQLVDSLRNDDIVGYAHCWMSCRRITAIAKASSESIPADELEDLKVYFQQRNRQVAHSFSLLSDVFGKEGGIARLKLVDVTIQGKIKEREEYGVIHDLCECLCRGFIDLLRGNRRLAGRHHQHG